jgi:hypothetical protein
MAQLETLKAEYDAAYAVVLARHEADESVSNEEQSRLCKAEADLTEYERGL